MEVVTFKNFVLPIIKTLDTYNSLLEFHHKRTAVISYHLGKELNLSKEDMFTLVVAASIHDIGAITIRERDDLLSEEVQRPKDHCMMGFRMLESHSSFKDVAYVIKHHHIHYDELATYNEEISFLSHVLHFADRIDIMSDNVEKSAENISSIQLKLKEQAGTLFHPLVYSAFEKLVRNSDFWSSIQELSIDSIFNLLDIPLHAELNYSDVVSFSQVVSHIIDFRNQFTSSHSFCVAHLAKKFGEWLDMSSEDCDKLLVAGYFHDIGKISLEPELIEKHDAFSQDDKKQYALHSHFTEKILEDLKANKWFEDVIEWASHHHVDYQFTNGSNSIEHSKAEFGARVIAYADIISALLEDRPYRQRLHIDFVFDILEKEYSTLISYDIFEKLVTKKDEINNLFIECNNEIQKLYKKEYPNNI